MSTQSNVEIDDAPTELGAEGAEDANSELGRRWAWLSELGTSGLPSGKAKRVRITNQTAVIVGAIVVPYGPLFAVIGANFLALCVIPLCAAYVMVLWLNHRRQNGVARVLMLTAGNTAVFTYSASLGLETNIHLIFLVTALAPLLFCEPSERRFILTGMTVALGLQMIRVLGFDLSIPPTPLSDAAVTVLGVILVPTTSLMAILIVLVFYRENYRQENRLEHLVARLRERGDVLRATNEQLSQEATARAVAQRKAIELQSQLLDAARKAGMAEIATDVLHNVGNATNSVGVNVKLLHARLARPMLPELSKLASWVDSPQFPLRDQLSRHERTEKLPSFLAALDGKLRDQQEELLGFVTTAANGASEVERILLDQQQLASADRIVEAIDVDELFDAAVAISGHDTSEVHLVREHEPSRFVADRASVLQILVHLVSNAIESLHAHDQDERTLTMAARGSGGSLRLSISDTGVGIDPQHVEEIFRSGFTTKTTGSGYGLHNSANLARELGGSLSVHSEGLGHGATFTLEIPFQAASDDTTAQIVRST